MVAMATHRVIGREGALPWRLSADLRHFKQLTLGHPIIMGRVTHQSIGRLLPGRLNIVVSRGQPLVADGAQLVGSFEEALALARDAEESMVIGGHALYQMALPRAARMLVTEVHAEPSGDVSFPVYSCADWIETARENYPADVGNEHPDSFVELRRRL